MAGKLSLKHYAIDPDHFRHVLRGKRQELGLTQLQLADRAGVSSATVHKLESGRLSVHLDLFVRVVDALGMPLSDLISFNGSVTTPRPDPKAIRLAAILEAGDQTALLDFLAGESRRNAGARKSKRRPNE